MGSEIKTEKKSYRMQYRFWLDVARDEEYEIAEYIEKLKENRNFAQTIRDALNLIQDLRRGSLKMLLRLFPWVWEQIEAEIRAEFIEQEAAKFLPEFQDYMERMENLLEKNAAVAIQPPQLPQPTSKSISSGKPAADFDLEIKRSTSNADSNAAWNFKISSALQVYGTCDFLSPEIIEYGLRTGQIPPHMVKDKPKKSEEKSDNGPKEMDVPQFDAPEFDENDEDLMSLF